MLEQQQQQQPILGQVHNESIWPTILECEDVREAVGNGDAPLLKTIILCKCTNKIHPFWYKLRKFRYFEDTYPATRYPNKVA